MPVPASTDCATCPHQAECQKSGSCLDEINAAQLARRRSCPHPTLMTPTQAIECMEALKRGLTLRRITGGGSLGKPIVSLTKLNAHCAAYEVWGAEAMRLARANAKAVDKGHRRKQTHCKFGHPLSGSNVRTEGPGRRFRRCLACQKRQEASPPLPTAETIEAVTAALNGGKTITQICHGVLDGKAVAEPILQFRNLKRYRVLNQDYDRFIREASAKNKTLDHLRRYPAASRRKLIQPSSLVRGPTLTGVIAGPSHEIFTVVDRAVPRNLDFETRKEVMSEMMLAILEGKLTLEEAPLRYREFLRITNRMFPTQYAKFGGSPLVSLDESLFDNGSGTRGDIVTRALWD
jgi:hypothetical protein